MVKFLGASENVSFMQFSENIDGFRQNNEFTILVELVQLYKQNPLEKFSIFTIYQNYVLSLALKTKWAPCRLKLILVTYRDSSVVVQNLR